MTINQSQNMPNEDDSPIELITLNTEDEQKLLEMRNYLAEHNSPESEDDDDNVTYNPITFNSTTTLKQIRTQLEESLFPWSDVIWASNTLVRCLNQLQEEFNLTDLLAVQKGFQELNQMLVDYQVEPNTSNSISSALIESDADFKVFLAQTAYQGNQTVHTMIRNAHHAEYRPRTISQWLAVADFVSKVLLGAAATYAVITILYILYHHRPSYT